MSSEHFYRSLLALALMVPVAPALAQAPPAQGASPSSGLVEPEALVPVPGTRVSIAPPPGFARSDRFAGFYRPDAGASIVVNELSAPVDAIRGSMTRRALAEQGMELLSTSRAVAGGIVGTLYSVREQVRGRPYRKWMALIGNERQTVLLSANFPEALADELSLPLKQSLLSSGWSPGARVELRAGLPFTVPEVEGLAAFRRVGGMLVMTDPSRGDAPSPADPLLVVGEAVAERGITDPADFARKRLRQFDRVHGLRDLAAVEVTVDGRDAQELTATGDDVYGSGPMLVYQLLVPNGRRYTLVQALVGIAEEAEYLPRFRQLARGIGFSE